MNLTRSLAAHWAPHGVAVNALATGFVDTTGLQEEVLGSSDHDDHRALVKQDIPTGRLAEPDEIASVVLILCSAGTPYINRATIVADGALYLSNWTPWWDPDAP